MAITIIDQPGTHHTLYNETEYILNSTNKHLRGFKYIVQVISGGTIASEMEQTSK